MLALCFILEGNAGDIPTAAIKETIQQQAKLMKASMGKRWLSYTNLAIRDLLAKDKWHSSADGGRSVVVHPGGRAKQVLFPLAYNASPLERGDND